MFHKSYNDPSDTEEKHPSVICRLFVEAGFLQTHAVDGTHYELHDEVEIQRTHIEEGRKQSPPL